ncbi:hypothetical protein [Desulfofustis limnaeus]|jgi:hypothetical protein|nr:hypothetical protein [Desulfofustis limnaeus]MDX9894978.1 hypothetical protein [Desulfofustis sp.]
MTTAHKHSSAPPQMPVCRLCRYYFITHDPARPYGCRAMGFKSRHNPAHVVFASSGMACQVFQPRDATPGSSEGPAGRE